MKECGFALLMILYEICSKILNCADLSNFHGFISMTKIVATITCVVYIAILKIIILISYSFLLEISKLI